MVAKLAPATRVLRAQIFILRAPLAPQARHVADLHVLRQQLAVRHVVGEAAAHGVAPIEPARARVVLEEGAAVVVLLQVRHAPAAAAAAAALGALGRLLLEERAVLGLALGRRQRAPPLNLGALALGLLERVARAPQALQLTQLPRGALGSRCCRRRRVVVAADRVRVVDGLELAAHLLVPLPPRRRARLGVAAQLLLHELVGGLLALALGGLALAARFLLSGSGKGSAGGTDCGGGGAGSGFGRGGAVTPLVLFNERGPLEQLLPPRRFLLAFLVFIFVFVALILVIFAAGGVRRAVVLVFGHEAFFCLGPLRLERTDPCRLLRRRLPSALVEINVLQTSHYFGCVRAGFAGRLLLAFIVNVVDLNFLLILGRNFRRSRLARPISRRPSRISSHALWWHLDRFSASTKKSLSVMFESRCRQNTVLIHFNK
jgi:uncharacterized membrane protein YgcG